MSPLEIAITQIGKQEIPKGSNWGEDVQKYLQSVGINFPASWCMAFVYWCVEQSCHINGIENPLIKTGGVLSQWNNFKGFKIAKPTFGQLEKGDIFIMDLGNGLGHCGFIYDDDKLTTIEGNTNDTGSREGFEVCIRERKVESFKGIIRVNYTAT